MKTPLFMLVGLRQLHKVVPPNLMLVLLGILVIVVFIPGGQAQSIAEDFEDDTPGGDPSGMYVYTKNGAPSVSNAEAFGGVNSFLLPATSAAMGQFDMGSQGWDVCAQGARASMWIYFDSLGWGGNAPAVRFSDTSGTESVSEFSLLVQGGGDGSAFINIEGSNNDTGVDFIADIWYELEWYDFNCGSSSSGVTLDITPDGGSTTTTVGSQPDDFSMKTIDTFKVGGHTVTAIGPLYVDDFTFIVPGVPTPPAGVSGTVVDGFGSSRTATIAFPLSSNDPDQTVGEFDYFAEVDAGGGFVRQTFNGGSGPTCSQGICEGELNYEGSSWGVWEFRVIGQNLGVDGIASCEVQLDMDDEGNTDVCGDDPPPPPFGGGNPESVPPITLPGLDPSVLGDDLGISTAAAGWFLALLLIGGLAGGLASIPSFGLMGGILGFILGTGVSVAFGFIPFWFPFLLVIVGGAVIVLMSPGGG